ncbi:MAG: peptide ABC transporter substrate-binding protein [Ardenticatenales bacterium]
MITLGVASGCAASAPRVNPSAAPSRIEGAAPPAATRTAVPAARDGGTGGAGDARAGAAGGPTGAAVVAPRSGGTLRLPGSPPTTLDPHRARDVVSAEYLYEIYSGLVTLADDLTIVPDLAEKWDTSADGTVFTFTLRAGRFHDGTPVTSEDVRWSLERACDPATAPDLAGTYLGDVVGCADKLAGRAESVAGVVTPDPTHVVLRIDAPKAYFLAKLTYPTSFVLDRRQLEADSDWANHPIGSGPFRLAEYDPDTRLRLERHAGFHGARPWLDAVEYDLRPLDPVTRFENGELDAAPVGSSDLARVQDPLNALSRLVVQGPGDLGVSYIGFDTNLPPFDDVHVRRAFSLAVDKERIASIVLGGAVRPVDTILPPGMPGFDPLRSPLRHAPADGPRLARAELAASRYAAGLPPITITASGGGGNSPSTLAVVERWRTVLGANVTVEQTPWDTFQSEVDGGAYQAWVLGWVADYPDPQNFLDVLFHSGSPLNATHYRNADVDRWLEAARTEATVDRRLDLYGRAEAQILSDAPWLPLMSGIETWLVSPAVHGFTVPPIVVQRLGRIWIAPAVGSR